MNWIQEELDEQSEMELLRQEVYDSMCKVAEYRAGNTELLAALMRLAEQHGTPLEQSALEHAQKVLFDAGMVNGHDGTLNWAALAERKDNRWTWEHCVRTLVKQPAEVERLLKLPIDQRAPPDTSLYYAAKYGPGHTTD